MLLRDLARNRLSAIAILAPGLLLLLVLVASCRRLTRDVLPPGPDDPAQNLRQLDTFAERVQRESILAAWRSATEGVAVEPKPFGVVPLLLLTDAEVAGLERRLQEAESRRCLGAVHAFAMRMQSESDPRVARERAAVNLLRARLPDLSQVSTDEGDLLIRREQWLAQASIARELAPRLRTLIEARNQWATRRMGVPTSYLELMRRYRGYDPVVAGRLEQDVREALHLARERSRRPWEFERIDPQLAQRMAERFDAAHCMERASSVFAWLGLSPERSMEVRKAKDGSFAAYPLEPPVRLAVTITPGAGITAHWSALHEFGHAAMSLLATSSSCRTSRRAVSPAVSESCAKISERLFFAPEWLATQGVPAAEVARLQSWEVQSEGMRMRSILADLEMERVLYRDPRANVMNAYIRIQREQAGVETPGDVPAWALKRHLAYEPLARADYLLARCAQAAVYRRLRALPGGLLGSAARAVLRDEVYAGATGMQYEEWFRRATGKNPTCEDWIASIGAAPHALPGL
jgi:hypothetical protein